MKKSDVGGNPAPVKALKPVARKYDPDYIKFGLIMEVMLSGKYSVLNVGKSCHNLVYCFSFLCHEIIYL